MKTEQSVYLEKEGWITRSDSGLGKLAQVVFLFGNRDLLKDKLLFEQVRKNYPEAEIVGCSTAGEILKDEIFNNSIVSTAVYFEKTKVKVNCEPIHSMDDSFKIGAKLIAKIEKSGLKHIMILSEGLGINGSELIKGMYSGNHIDGVSVTGGLAGDQALFDETVVVCNAPGKSNLVLAIGFYGSEIKIGYGSMGGWDSFGVDRLVTRSKSNILYELDGQPALELYKKYLGVHAAGLPASALLFPLSLKLKDSDAPLVRTVLSVNENDGSMIFAGDVPEGEYVRLMKAGFERLIEGASNAAEMSEISLGDSEPDLVILISCVGRKLVLKQRIEDEIESVREVVGKQATITGFYSYGEICPAKPFGQRCDFHNQTMTITSFKEM